MLQLFADDIVLCSTRRGGSIETRRVEKGCGEQRTEEQ